MKTKILNLLIAAFATSQIAAFPLHSSSTKHGNDPVKTAPDTSKTVETIFNMSIDTTEEKLLVDLTGEFDKYSSVSLTNNRLTEISFHFVKNGKNQILFDLSKLEKGSYFIVLNTNKEIRIKRFVVN